MRRADGDAGRDVREDAMRNVLAAAAAALTISLMSAAPRAQEATITIQGQLVEMSCLTKLGAGKALDESHATCARECASKGNQLGIFTEDDGVYRITGDWSEKNRAKVVALLGKPVTGTGVRVRGADYSKIIDLASLTPGKK
jgi:hypothetical protein